MSGFLDEHIRLDERLRKIEVGTHPTLVTPDGYGRNTPWKRLSVPFPQVVTDDPKPTDGLYRCVRGDVVYFKTLGPGFDLSELDNLAVTFPTYLFDVGKTGYSADSMRFQGFCGAYALQLIASPGGSVYLAGKPPYLTFSSLPFVISGAAWDLG